MGTVKASDMPRATPCRDDAGTIAAWFRGAPPHHAGPVCGILRRTMAGRRLLSAAGVAIALGCGGEKGGPAEIRDYAVTHYEVALDLESREATVELTITPEDGGECLEIDFGPASVEEVRLDGEPADDLELDGGRLFACGPGWSAGEAVTVSVTAEVPEETWGQSQVGFSVTEDAEGNDFTYLLSWVGECDRNGACDARPDRFATYRFTVDHPAGVRVLCPGEIVAQATRTVCTFDFDGGPTYSTFAVLASRSWVETPLGTWAGGVEATLFDTPSTGIAAAFSTTDARAHLEWMADTFGAFPYGGELRFVVAPTYWAGFEHPGTIALSEDLAGSNSPYADPLTHVVLHEITHQWAGDQTTLRSVHDFVWKEAMAEYLTFVTEEERISPSVAAATAAAWKEWSEFADHFPVPAEAPPLLDYYGDAYGPGPMVLFRQIEGLSSRADVLAAVATLLGGERAISVGDVREALETATGLDLAGYFDAWVYGEGEPAWPEAAVQVTDLGGGSVTVEVSLSTEDGVPRGCAFDVRLRDAGGTQSVDVRFDFGVDGAPVAPKTVTPGFTVAAHQVDPDAECLVWETGRRFTARPLARVEPWRVR